MRMEVTSFKDVIFNPVAQSKFVHTVSAGYMIGAMFVLSISAWYLLRGRNIDFAKRSMTVAASFGLAAALSVVVLGDESGYTVSENQKMKMAAIEAMWETEPRAGVVHRVRPAGHRRTHAPHYAIRIPWVMGLIGTRSIDQQIPGIADLVEDAKLRIGTGIQAYDAMLVLRADKDNAQARATLAAHDKDMGYALLLKRFMDDPRKATPADIQKAADSTIPNVPVLFWSFRIMVGLRHVLHPAVRLLVLAGAASDSSEAPTLVPEGGAMEPAAAVDRRGTGLDRRRVRPPTVGDRRRAADRAGRVLGDRGPGLDCRWAASCCSTPCSPSSTRYLMLKFARKGPDGLGMWPQRHDAPPATAQTA